MAIVHHFKDRKHVGGRRGQRPYSQKSRKNVGTINKMRYRARPEQ